MLSQVSHQFMKDTYDRAMVKGKRVEEWHSFLDHLYETEEGRENPSQRNYTQMSIRSVSAEKIDRKLTIIINFVN